MKRHEYLKSAIILFVAAVIFAAAGLIIRFIVLKPLLSDDNTALENLILNFIPGILYIFSLFFVIMGIYSVVNERSIEKGENILAKVTGVKEYFIGSDNKTVHYNLFCQWKDPETKKVYKYTMKNIPYDPSSKVSDGKVVVRISKKDPRQYFIDL